MPGFHRAFLRRGFLHARTLTTGIADPGFPYAAPFLWLAEMNSPSAVIST